MITSRKKQSSVPALIITLAVFALVAVFAFAMLGGARQTSTEEALRAVRENVSRALLSCYAYEGFYPDGIDYLEEHYSLVFNKDKYFIHYRKFADNLFPEIVVIELGAQTE